MSRQRHLVRHMGKEAIWNWLLGLPVEERLKHWDQYGTIGNNDTKSYYITRKFGFTSYWRAGRLPNWHFEEAFAFAHENCGIKEKWKRMVIWNCLFDKAKEELLELLGTSQSERKRHVITKLLPLKEVRSEDE